MWKLSLADVRRIKGQLEARRARIEAKYLEDTKALDAEFTDIETLERVAAAFANKYHESESADQIEAVNGAATEAVAAEPDPNGDPDAEAAPDLPSAGPSDGSKWRLRIRRNEAAALAEAESAGRPG